MLVFKAIISDETCDAVGDVLRADGCDLSEFTGQLLVNHNPDRIVGVVDAGAIESDGTRLIAKGVLLPKCLSKRVRKANEVLEHVMKHGSLLGVSVGCDYIETRPATDEDRKRYGRHCERVVTKWRLLEISLADTPCNSRACVTSVEKYVEPRLTRLQTRRVIRDVVTQMCHEGLIDSGRPVASR